MKNKLLLPFCLAILLGLTLLLSACSKPDQSAESTSSTDASASPTATPAPETAMASPAPAAHADTDMVLLTDLDPTIVMENPLATTNNFFQYRFFRSSEAWMRYGTAQKIAAVQRDLKSRGLGLKIWAAYRPFVVQVKMFELAGGNGDWISDPYKDTGKKTHVRGAAVDCTLIDASGKELEMPTPYLDFKNGAAKMKRDYMKLPRQILDNRRLLSDVMDKHGLEPYEGEWWHFQDPGWGRFPVIQRSEFPEIHQRLLTDEMLRMKE